ncbi:MAG: hypothetical protein ACQKBY_00460 [Verrucomicrobiales bacterium]
MNKQVISSLIAAILASHVFAEEAVVEKKITLPYESEKILRKLQVWEEAQQARLDQEIKEKRAEVIQSLEQHLDIATKRGKLDEALAIREEIERLTPKPPADIRAEEARKEEFAKLVGRWDWHDGKEVHLITENGEVKRIRPGGSWSGKIVFVDGSHVIQIRDKNAYALTSRSENLLTLSYLDRDKEDFTLRRLKD